MGGKRRKSKSGPIKKESRYKIPARFDCPLCDVKSSIVVAISRPTGIATVYCRSCRVGKSRKWPILPREQSVDVFFRFREELLKFDEEFLKNNHTDVNHIENLDRKIGSLVELVQQENRQSTFALQTNTSLESVDKSRHGSTQHRKRQRLPQTRDKLDETRSNDVAEIFSPPSLEEEGGDRDFEHEEEQYAMMFE